MSRRPQKGVFHHPGAEFAIISNSLLPNKERHNQVEEKSDNPFIYRTVWNRGNGAKPEDVEVDLSCISKEPLMASQLHAITGIFCNVSPSTAKNYRKRLLVFVNYIGWYRAEFGSAPAVVSDFTSHFTNFYIQWQFGRRIAVGQKSADTCMFLRILTEIGVPGERHPPNPFPFEAIDGDDIMDTLSSSDLRSILKQAKYEANIVIDRTREAHRLAAAGNDPRRIAGGRSGDWQAPENRAYILKRVLLRRIEKFDDMRFRLGHGSILAMLERYPGAQCINPDGTLVRRTGWNGHVRWFFPWPEDILPFVILLMIRTGWNLTTATSVRSRRWRKPFPFTLTADRREDCAYVTSFKSRGRSDVDAETKVIQAPSLKRPWSHPYRVLQFVDYLTAGLRREIRRRAVDLEGRFDTLTSNEKMELQRLISISDDMFIYKTEKGITSLRWQAQRNNDPASRQLKAFADRAGVDFGYRDLRNAVTLGSYEQSENNLSVARIVADHADDEVTGRYIGKRRTVQRVWKNAAAIFDCSVRLIEKDSFGTDDLRTLLSDQGFSEFETGNLMDAGAETIWGNRCADIQHPPGEFSAGHRTGNVCATQDCIDGCPHARWFADSIEHVARQLVIAEVQRDRLGMESTMFSSHQSRIDRLNHLLSLWPSSVATAAINAAQAELLQAPTSIAMAFSGANP